MLHMMQSQTEIKVRAYHLDGFGRINSVRYLEFLEHARWEYVEKLPGVDGASFFREKGMAFVVVNININYRHPAGLGDVLLVETEVTRVGNRSITMAQRICLKSNNTLIADAEVTFVIIDVVTGRSIPLEGELKRYWSGGDYPFE